MSYLKYTLLQRDIIHRSDFNGFKLTRNTLDILFYIQAKKSATVSEIARDLLHTNYRQTYSTIKAMKAAEMLIHFQNPQQKGKANYLFLTDNANDYVNNLSRSFLF